jgi:nucleotide-binding universal stress UspA family protein
MAIAFDNILIPVDFSLNTEVAIKKAVGMAGREEAVLHLLHVIKPGRLAEHQFARWNAEKELEKWRETIRERFPSVRTKTNVLQGRSVQRMIIECAGLLKPDLIIIGKKDPPRRWSFFRGVWPDAIAKQSNCPVLTVKPGCADSRTRIILIPIRDFLPERKLEWAVMLAKKYRAQVHLLAIQERVEAKDWALSQVFLKAYHQLREHLHHPIEYSATSRQSTAKAALDCAELIMADMIVLNPETESGVSGFPGYRHISDLLKMDSKIQVLDVEPYKTN